MAGAGTEATAGTQFIFSASNAINLHPGGLIEVKGKIIFFDDLNLDVLHEILTVFLPQM